MLKKVKMGMEQKEYWSDGTIYYPVVKESEMDEVGYWLEEMQPGNPDSAMLVPAIDKEVLTQAMKDIYKEQTKMDLDYQIFMAEKEEKENQRKMEEEQNKVQQEWLNFLQTIEENKDILDEMNRNEEDTDEIEEEWYRKKIHPDQRGEIMVNTDEKMIAIEEKYHPSWWDTHDEDWEYENFNPKDNPWNLPDWSEVMDSLTRFQHDKIE